MSVENHTAYCGIYCPDCIHFKNKYSVLARSLRDHLHEIEFDKYAKIESPFGEDLRHWGEFEQVLDLLAESQCIAPCRSGGGCSGKPCTIMECCLSRGFAGCWECAGVEECGKFDFLEPRCGQMPKNNIREIRRNGLGGWEDRRDKFYIWQKDRS